MKFTDGSWAKLMGSRQHSGRGPAFLSEQEKQKQDRHGKILDAMRLLISLQKTGLISVRLSINFDGGTIKILCLHFSGAVTAKYASKNVFS